MELMRWRWKAHSWHNTLLLVTVTNLPVSERHRSAAVTEDSHKTKNGRYTVIFNMQARKKCRESVETRVRRLLHTYVLAHDVDSLQQLVEEENIADLVNDDVVFMLDIWDHIVYSWKCARAAKVVVSSGLYGRVDSARGCGLFPLWDDVFKHLEYVLTEPNLSRDFVRTYLQTHFAPEADFRVGKLPALERALCKGCDFAQVVYVRRGLELDLNLFPKLLTRPVLWWKNMENYARLFYSFGADPVKFNCVNRLLEETYRHNERVVYMYLRRILECNPGAHSTVRGELLKRKLAMMMSLRSLAEDHIIDWLHLFPHANVDGPDDCPILHLAVRLGYYDLARYLVEERGADVNIRNRHGMLDSLQILHFEYDELEYLFRNSSEHDQVQLVKLFVRHGYNTTGMPPAVQEYRQKFCERDSALRLRQLPLELRRHVCSYLLNQ